MHVLVHPLMMRVEQPKEFQHLTAEEGRSVTIAAGEAGTSWVGARWRCVPASSRENADQLHSMAGWAGKGWRGGVAWCCRSTPIHGDGVLATSQRSAKSASALVPCQVPGSLCKPSHTDTPTAPWCCHKTPGRHFACHQHLMPLTHMSINAILRPSASPSKVLLVALSQAYKPLT